ncbi:MAG: hypothetical protein KC613_19580 [Myxococcales bacterium]|nr:hypothetical protein [Myxococcales bacterium]MCB9521801.1 hypothetical protein [Myxococcales bacterium]
MALRPLLLFAVLWALPACVTVYQPLSGAHRPVAVDLRGPNLKGVAVTVRCLPSADMPRAESGLLCRKLARLFENQGATVQTTTSRERPEAEEAPAAEGATAEAGPEPTEALEVELTSRRLHEKRTSFLFFDYISDYTFAQDIVVRDERGALLARERLVGRFFDTLGFNENTDLNFSRLFYGAVSQIALNARMRRKVLAAGR